MTTIDIFNLFDFFEGDFSKIFLFSEKSDGLRFELSPLDGQTDEDFNFWFLQYLGPFLQSEFVCDLNNKTITILLKASSEDIEENLFGSEKYFKTEKILAK